MLRILIYLLLHLNWSVIIIRAENEIKIGAIFDTNINENKQVFQYAIDRANKIKLDGEDFRLEGTVVEVLFGNEYSTSRGLCNLLGQGVSAIFGPSDKSSSIHAANVCDTKEIPYIETRLDVESKMPIVNMYPNPKNIAQMLVDLVIAANWKGFTVLYESAEWLPRMAELLKIYDSKGYTITVRRFDLGLSTRNYRPILRRVKQSSDKCIIVESSIENLEEVLKQAQQVGIMTDHHEFIITNLDAHTIDLEPYQYSGTNITIVRLVDTENPIIKDISEYISEVSKEGDKEKEKEEEEEKENDGEPDDENDENKEIENGETKENDENEEGNEAEESGEQKEEETANQEKVDEESEYDPTRMRIQTALLHDGIILLAETFKQLGIDQIQPSEIYCGANDSMWENGISISNFMRNTVIDGLTGTVKFDTDGKRSYIAVQILQLNPHGLTPIGMWNSDAGLTISREPEPPPTGIDNEAVRNRTFIVLTSLSPPYGMLKDSALELTGNDRFEGFGIDIIHELSLMLGFKYIFKLQEDGKYGSINNETKEWNGMIRELQDERAHLAITDLTVTSERESGCDFTMPFMNLGISILFRKPSKEPPSTFSFMSPFSTDVWMSLGVAYFTVSVCLFVLGRISPAEWDNPYPCIEEPTELENQFSFANSMWFCIGALLQQGSEIAPKAPSTRIVAAMWWFFTLIMVSSYTANLAAFLTVESLVSPIKSVEDLKECGLPGKECPVKFGAKKGGSTLNFFKEAEHPTYRNMYTYMSEHPESLTSSNEQGLEWAKTDNYAFLMESSSIEYIIERNCDVTQIGSPLDDKGYGIAMRKNSNYRNALSEGVLRLQESGKLAALKIKWWNEKKGGGACSDPPEEGALALEMANVEGIFYLLIVGVIIAILFALIDVLLETRKSCKINKTKDENEAKELGMENVNGVFLVLFGGSIVASVYGFAEWCLNCYKRSRKTKVSFKEEFFAEMKFIIKCESNTKVVRNRKSSSIDSQHSAASHHTNRSHETTGAGTGSRSNATLRYAQKTES